MIVASVIIVLYLLFVLWTVWGFWALPKMSESPLSTPKTGFSVMIPFKDEAQNLDVLMRSIRRLHYPLHLFEIIMIDDASEDDSVAIIKGYSLENLRLFTNRIKSGSPKKDALEIGIRQAKFDWILTTDADCELPVDWLQNYDNACQNTGAKMLLAPVQFFDDSSLLTQFQQIEFVTMQGITMAGVYWRIPFLSNGANMGFEKKAFIEVNGYQDNNQIASGDDVFLLEKFNVAFRNRIKFIKNPTAIVGTNAQDNLNHLVQQKIRWGAKTKHYRSVFPKLLGVLLLIVNLLFVVSMGGLFYNVHYIYIISAKVLLDLSLFFAINRFYQTKINPIYAFISSLIYPFYFIYISLVSINGKFEWKNRKYANK